MATRETPLAPEDDGGWLRIAQTTMSATVFGLGAGFFFIESGGILLVGHGKSTQALVAAGLASAAH